MYLTKESLNLTKRSDFLFFQESTIVDRDTEGGLSSSRLSALEPFLPRRLYKGTIPSSRSLPRRLSRGEGDYRPLLVHSSLPPLSPPSRCVVLDAYQTRHVAMRRVEKKKVELDRGLLKLLVRTKTLRICSCESEGSRIIENLTARQNLVLTQRRGHKCVGCRLCAPSAGLTEDIRRGIEDVIDADHDLTTEEPYDKYRRDI
jgi:hypothetical protein